VAWRKRIVGRPTKQIYHSEILKETEEAKKLYEIKVI
jgi:hypothetical protein